MTDRPIVHGTVPRARDADCEELLVWTERWYRDRYLLGAVQIVGFFAVPRTNLPMTPPGA